MPDKQRPGVEVSIYFDRRVLAALDRFAVGQNRSRSNMLDMIIREKVGIPPKGAMGESDED